MAVFKITILLFLTLKTLHCSKVVTETRKITNGNSSEGDYFGRSVAVSQRYLAVGSFFDDVGEVEDIGSVTVFKKSGTTIAEAGTKIVPEHDGDSGEEFGRSICVNEEFVVVGAMGHKEYRGAVYIYNTDDRFTSNHKLELSGVESNTYFGVSIGINDNNVLAVGSNGHGGTAHIYTYNNNNNTWMLKQSLRPSDMDESDVFASELAISRNHLAINTWTGLVYVYTRSTNGKWKLSQKIREKKSSWKFGDSLALRGNGMVVGDTGGNKAYVYQLIGTRWKRVAVLKSNGIKRRDRFGSSVDLYGDVVVVAANRFSFSGRKIKVGRVYVFHYNRHLKSWEETEVLQASDSAKRDYFGNPVRIYGDVVFSGSLNQAAGYSKGALYVYDISASVVV